MNAIVPTNTKALSFTMIDPQQLAQRLKLMIANGKAMSDPEAMALAQYSIATDLNPFTGECYYMTGVGPGPGIAGWRKKAEEQLEYEAHRAAEPIARFWCDYEEPVNGETGNLNPGDVAVKAVLHDTLTKNAWEKRTLSHYIELVKNDIKENAWDIAKELAGPEPVWTAIGIVRAGENFGGDKMNRYERTCKRAEKAAIRKRFPRVNLPEPQGFDPADVVETTFVEQPKRTEAEIMADLGYGTTVTHAEAPTTLTTPEPISAEDPETMTLDQAKSVKTEKGLEIGMLNHDQLKVVADKNTNPIIRAAAVMVLNDWDSKANE